MNLQNNERLIKIRRFPPRATSVNCATFHPPQNTGRSERTKRTIPSAPETVKAKGQSSLEDLLKILKGDKRQGPPPGFKTGSVFDHNVQNPLLHPREQICKMKKWNHSIRTFMEVQVKMPNYHQQHCRQYLQLDPFLENENYVNYLRRGWQL